MESVNKIGKNEQGNSVHTIFIVCIVIKFISKRRPSRHGGKAVPGELSEAEANGDPPKVKDLDAPESGDAAKPKKKKKKTAVCFYCGFQSNILTSPYLVQGQEV